MKINANPEYALAGYYDFYGKAAVVWVSSFGDLLASVYDPERRTFLHYHDPRRIALDGFRIGRTQMTGLIRATTKALIDNKICDVCGQNETWGVHNECGDVILARLAEPPDPDGTNGRFRETIIDSIKNQLSIEIKGPPPTGFRLITVLYYWMVAFPRIEESAPLKWETLNWALKGQVWETVKYLQTIRTPRSEKLLTAVFAYRDHKFKRPTTFAGCWGLENLKHSFGWIKEELEKGEREEIRKTIAPVH